MKLKAVDIRKEFIRELRDTNVFEAVKPCNIEISEKEFIVVSGKSGSGKSTLLNMLSGILEPTSGEVLYDDKNIYSMKDEELSKFRNKHIGFIPQGKSAIMSLSVLENVMVPLSLYGERDEEKALLLLEKFDIADLKDVMPDELSGGELRRMSIARALMRDPDVIFADEPTGDLDDENTRIVFEALRKTADEGTAVFVVTHEEDGKSYSDRAYRMNSGELNG